MKGEFYRKIATTYTCVGGAGVRVLRMAREEDQLAFVYVGQRLSGNPASPSVYMNSSLHRETGGAGDEMLLARSDPFVETGAHGLRREGVTWRW